MKENIFRRLIAAADGDGPGFPLVDAHVSVEHEKIVS